MTLLSDVVSRLSTELSELGAIETVVDLAALVQNGALPQRDVTLFVVPLGFDDLGGESAANIHTQSIQEAIGVIIAVKARGDAKALKSLPTIDGIKDRVVNGLAGWAPDHTVGVFKALRGRIVSVSGGLVLFQLDFAIVDQLRITTS